MGLLPSLETETLKSWSQIEPDLHLLGQDDDHECQLNGTSRPVATGRTASGAWYYAGISITFVMGDAHVTRAEVAKALVRDRIATIFQAKTLICLHFRTNLAIPQEPCAVSCP